MKIVIQRVNSSNVKVNNKIIGEIKLGLNLLVGFKNDDNQEVIDKMIDKIINLRIFEDQTKKMNLSLKDVNGSILAISQFTLYADANSGRRPSFSKAAKADVARDLYNYFLIQLTKQVDVASGEFGADMEVSIVNNGPVTIILDSDEK